MIRPHERALAKKLDNELINFSSSITPLLGIADQHSRWVLVEQLIESKRRVAFISVLRNRNLSPARSDPHSDVFDPIRGAIWLFQNGDEEEAFWLLFLATQFSKHSIDGWRLTKAVYGKLGCQPYWKWNDVYKSPVKFAQWADTNAPSLKAFRFGNHRKYETLKPGSTRGLGAAVKHYVARVSVYGSQRQTIQAVISGVNDPNTQFEFLYKFFRQNVSWGRLATFDHVTMLQKVGLIDARPGRTFLSESTGPKAGVNLLLGPTSLTMKQKEGIIFRLGNALGLGQQEMEDALCNWQKSPAKFVAFR